MRCLSNKRNQYIYFNLLLFHLQEKYDKTSFNISKNCSYVASYKEEVMNIRGWV